MNGRYGPYITNKAKNAKIPKDKVPKELTLEECQAMLAAAPERRGRGMKRKRRAPAAAETAAEAAAGGGSQGARREEEKEKEEEKEESRGAQARPREQPATAAEGADEPPAE